VRLLVVGAGGHAKVVIDSALAAGLRSPAVVGSPANHRELLGQPVVHLAEGVAANATDVDGFIIAIGDNATVPPVAEYCAARARTRQVIHPSALLGTDVEYRCWHAARTVSS